MESQVVGDGDLPGIRKKSIWLNGFTEQFNRINHPAILDM